MLFCRGIYLCSDAVSIIYVYIHYTTIHERKKKLCFASHFFSFRLGWFFHLLSIVVNLFRVSSPFKLLVCRYLHHCAACPVYIMVILRSICIICVRTLYVSIHTNTHTHLTAHYIYIGIHTWKIDLRPSRPPYVFLFSRSAVVLSSGPVTLFLL